MIEASLRKKITETLQPIHLEIVNESSQHAHHAHHPKRQNASHDHGETHFFVHVVSNQFEGLALIQRHRLVQDLYKEERELGLHALSLKTQTQAEFLKV